MSITAELNLEDDGEAFIPNDFVPAFVLLEAMAQAAGVLLRSLFSDGGGGVLLGVSDARLPSGLKRASCLTLCAQLLRAMPPFFDFAGEVISDGSSVASANIQIFSRRDE